MLRRTPLMGALVLGVSLLVGCGGSAQPDRQPPRGVVSSAPDGPGTGRPGSPDRTAPAPGSDPIVLPNCLVTVLHKQDVPAQRDGVITAIHVKEGDVVKKDQLLAELDNRVARADVDIKDARIKSSQAKLDAAEKMRDEAAKRLEVSKNLARPGVAAVAPEQVRLDQLTFERHAAEARSEEQGLRLAEQEKKQAELFLKMHEIRSSIDGVVKTIFRERGEAVRNLEPVLHIQSLDRLRVEGLVDVQHLHRLQQARQQKKLRAVIEYSQPAGAEPPLAGHFEEVTAVAVSRSPSKPLIVSASTDGTAIVWDRKERSERLILRHPAPLRAVACTGLLAAANLCLTGAGDGKARLWDLDSPAPKLLHELGADGHRGAVLCVAFAPDGQSCVTGGDDKEICLWHTATGQLRCKFPTVHRGAITSLQFPLADRVVSAARDNTVAVWKVGQQEAELVRKPVPSRSGDVVTLGVSPDGQQVLFDQGRILRILGLPDGQPEAALQHPSGTANFTTFALFSADGRRILTSGGAGGRLQLWRAPDRRSRSFEVRHLVTADRPTSAAFAPDGSFVVTGTRDCQVLIWPLPASPDDNDRLLTAEVSLLEGEVQYNARQVRLWAEVANPARLLLPGTTVTVVLYDE